MAKKRKYDYDGFQKPYSVVQREGRNESTDTIWKNSSVWYNKGDKVFVMNKKGDNKVYTK